MILWKAKVRFLNTLYLNFTFNMQIISKFIKQINKYQKYIEILKDIIYRRIYTIIV